MFARASSRSLHKFQQLCTSAISLRQTQLLHTAQQPLLAGHSKWANIKHIKAQKDGERATVFARLTRQIRLAIQEGGSADPVLNSQLRSAMDEAVRKNMPLATIQNSIKRVQQTKTELKRYRLELRYKQKVFAVCVLYTDNLAAAKIELATLMRKAGATLVDAGHLFEDFGLIEASVVAEEALKKGLGLEERVTEDAIECGAEEVEVVDPTTGLVNFICRPIELNVVRRAIEEKGYRIENTEHIYVSKNVVQLTPEEQTAYEAFVRKLRDLPGLEDVFDNVQQEQSS